MFLIMLFGPDGCVEGPITLKTLELRYFWIHGAGAWIQGGGTFKCYKVEILNENFLCSRIQANPPDKI